MCKLTDERTLDELLNRPMDLLVLVGRDGDDNDDADADDVDDDNDDNDDDSDSDDDENDDEDNSDDGDDDSVDSLKEELTARDEKITRLQKKAKRQEGRISELIKERDDARSKQGKGDPDEQTKTDLEEANKSLTKVSDENTQLRLQVAFLQANGFDWQNPAVALKLADLSKVEIDEETGEVDKSDLKQALKNLAKEQPYLLKGKAPKDDDKDKDDKPKPPRSGSGVRSQRRTTADSKKKRQQALENRYPGLRNRG